MLGLFWLMAVNIRLIVKYRERLDEKEVKRKYHALYDSLKTEKKS